MVIPEIVAPSQMWRLFLYLNRTKGRMRYGKTAENQSSFAGGCQNQEFPRHDRTGHHQISDRPFYLRQHVPLRMGPAGVPDKVVIDDEKAMEADAVHQLPSVLKP